MEYHNNQIIDRHGYRTYRAGCAIYRIIIVLCDIDTGFLQKKCQLSKRSKNFSTCLRKMFMKLL